ncbi:WD repeat-containing protein 3 [Papilio xuthus]|uniref:WD repeat-containing protein 3 n=1 Tax=Papilio xuthus TaxID=66420 RepID=A0A194QBA2_PAPXU|nr:WD repeat-containing protein 3 [Papilio xuthus]
MGLTKQYLRYAPSGTFNIIASADCNSAHVSLNGISGRYIAVGACEHVIIWDMRIGEKAQVIPGENVVVSQIAASPTGNHMAVGYVDGNINVFELTNNEIVCVFAGHKSPVTSLQYDEQGHRIVSGSKDTEVILWDVVSETGVARFSGHKGAITSVLFINGKNCIISSSKDTFVKFWDIETKHCFKTLGGHQVEVWSAVLLKEERYLVTGSMDQELRVWKLNWTDKMKEEDKLVQQLEIVKIEETDNTEDTSVLQCHQVGTLVRGGRGRVVGLCTDLGQTVLGCFGTDSLLELFIFCSDDEAKARMTKRVKKQKKKLAKLKESGEADGDMVEVKELLTLSDEVRRLTSVKLSAKIKSASLLLGMTGELRVGVTLANNTVEMHSLKLGEENDVKCLKQITQPGHQKEPRCVAISSDNLAIISAAADSIKLWNRTSQACIRTIPVPCGRPCAVCFLPGDRHAAVGCADGTLLLIDVAAATVSEQIPAHTGACNSVGLLPDLRGCYTGGADKTVKIWQFELILDPTGDSKAKVLSLLHTRTLELEEAVCAVRVSPNNKFIAVGLMDSTVKIFFLDTFKFYLSLYGHKLPVLCLDISYDSTLIATGSGDRNVKIWGMDFGDCHKSIFAHNDSVTALQFVPSTHYLFTASKDGKIKQWDADTYENIITLNGHAGACWCVCVGAGGLVSAACGADGALRLFTRTDEPLVLGDLDEQEEGLATGEQHAPVPGLPGLVMPTKKTIGAEKAADSILECLSVGAEYEREVTAARGQHVPVPLLMTAYNCTTAEDFLLETLRKIRSSDLEEALLLLPLNAAGEMVRLVGALLSRAGGEHAELLARAACFLLRVHRAPLLADTNHLKHLIQIQARAHMRINELRDMVGCNLHALQWARREVEADRSEQLFRVSTGQRRARHARTKLRHALKRPIVSIT